MTLECKTAFKIAIFNKNLPQTCQNEAPLLKNGHDYTEPRKLVDKKETTVSQMLKANFKLTEDLDKKTNEVKSLKRKLQFEKNKNAALRNGSLPQKTKMNVTKEVLKNHFSEAQIDSLLLSKDKPRK